MSRGATMSRGAATMIAIVETDEAGRKSLHSPRIGRLLTDWTENRLVTPGERIGTLETLRRRQVLIVPEGVTGRVVGLALPSRPTLVEWGQRLCGIEPLLAGAGGLEGSTTSSLGSGQGVAVFRAPLDGQFYRRPSPEAPLFVEEGGSLVEGKQVGLIEVMKFFYPVSFSGTGTFRLVRFLVGDAIAVTAGQPLFEFELV